MSLTGTPSSVQVLSVARAPFALKLACVVVDPPTLILSVYTVGADAITDQTSRGAGMFCSSSSSMCDVVARLVAAPTLDPPLLTASGAPFAILNATRVRVPINTSMSSRFAAGNPVLVTLTSYRPAATPRKCVCPSASVVCGRI